MGPYSFKAVSMITRVFALERCVLMDDTGSRHCSATLVCSHLSPALWNELSATATSSHQISWDAKRFGHQRSGRFTFFSVTIIPGNILKNRRVENRVHSIYHFFSNNRIFELDQIWVNLQICARARYSISSVVAVNVFSCGASHVFVIAVLDVRQKWISLDRLQPSKPEFTKKHNFNTCRKVSAKTVEESVREKIQQPVDKSVRFLQGLTGRIWARLVLSSYSTTIITKELTPLLHSDWPKSTSKVYLIPATTWLSALTTWNWKHFLKSKKYASTILD